jgi:hypothetical protein
VWDQPLWARRVSAFNPAAGRPISPHRKLEREAIMEDAGPKHLVVNCSTCGDVKVASSDVTVRNCVDNDHWSYWFICPACRRRAGARTRRCSALAAVHAGSTLNTWHLPAELDEQRTGPPLTLIDLLELHLLLLEPDWIDHLS